MAEWSVEVPEELVEDLERDFQRGPIVNESGARNLVEETVARYNGMKIQVFSREHPPPHFRVVYQGLQEDFNICTGESRGGNALQRWHRNIRKWHELNRDRLMDAWNANRPDDCPVGNVEC